MNWSSRLSVAAFCLAICFFAPVLTQPIPAISASFPSQVTAASSFSFSLNLENAGSSFGYGPFVDVLIPPNVTVSNSATFLDMSIAPSNSVTFSTGSLCVAHALAKFANGTAQSVCGASGWKFLSFRFPLLSFAPSQPALTASLNAATPSASKDATWSFQYRSGFSYVDLSGSPLSGLSAWMTTNVSQRLTTTEISFNATEFSVGPQFIYQCTTVMTLASGTATLNGSIIVDLPCGVFLTSYSIDASVNVALLPSASTGGSQLVLNAANGNQSLTASVFTLTFNFYLNDTERVCPGYGNGSIRIIPFSVTAEWFIWDSSCSCFVAYIPGTVTKYIPSVPISLVRSAANINDVNAAGWSPLDSIANAYNMRISAGRCYSSVMLADALSDGLIYHPSSFPSFSFNGTTASSLSTAVLTRIGANPSMAVSISSALQASHGGILRGPSTVSISMPGSVLDRLSTGVNIFHGQRFSASAAVSFNEVNCATLASIGSSNITSTNSIRIVFGNPTISVYAVEGVSPPTTYVNGVPGIWPGALVTLRLRKPLPTTDVAGLSLDAFLPHPVLAMSGMSPVSSLASWSGSVPTVDRCSMGPEDTLRSVTGNSLSPALSLDSSNNRIIFTWSPDYENAVNSASQIDIVCTFRVSSLYFPNDLIIGMTSRGSETFVGDLFSFMSMNLMEPVLSLRKIIASSSNAASVISPATSINLNNAVTSAMLSTASLGNSISLVDAGDLVYIKLVIENTGSYSASDISLRDSIPSNFALVDGSLSAKLGNQQSISISGDLFGAGAFVSQLSRADTIGSNVLIVSYTMQALPTTVTGFTAVSIATLYNYAGVSGGPDFTSADLTASASFNGALVSLSLQINSTDVSTTGMGATVQQLAIGESATFFAYITFPEGITVSSSLVVNFPALTNGKIAAMSADIFSQGSSLSTSSATIATSDASGDSIRERVTVTFGNVTNAPDGSVSTGDILIIRIVGLVLNVGANARGNQLPTSATLTHSFGSVSASLGAEVVESAIVPSKACSPASPSAGTNSTCTITLRPTTGATYTALHQLTFTETFPSSSPMYTIFPNTITTSWADWTVSWNGAAVVSTVSSTPVPTSATITISYIIRVIDMPEWGGKNTTAIRLTHASAPSSFSAARPYTTNLNHTITLAGATLSGHSIIATSDPNTSSSRGNTGFQDLALGESATSRVTFRFAAGQGSNCRIRYDAPSSTNAKMHITSWNVVSVGSSVQWGGLQSMTSQLSSTRSDSNMNRLLLTLGTVRVPLGAATNTDTFVLDVTYYVPTNSTPRNNDTVATSTNVILQASVLTNDATLNANINVEIVEPALTVVKATSATTVVADVPITYRLTIQHAAASNAPAYDLLILDPYVSASSVVTASVPVSVPGAGMIKISQSVLLLGSSISVNYTFTPTSSSLEAGTSVTNVARLQYYSVADGSLMIAGLRQLYSVSSNAVIVGIPTPVSQMTLLANDLVTSLASGQSYSFGQDIFVRSVVVLPSAVTSNLVLTLNFPLSSGTPRMAFTQAISITPTAGVTTTVLGGFASLLTPSSVTTSGSTVAFSFGNVTSSLAGSSIAVVFKCALTDIAANTHGASLTISASVNWRTASSAQIVSTSIVIDEPILFAQSVSVNPLIVYTGSNVRLSTALSSSSSRQTSAQRVSLVSSLPANRFDLVDASVSAPVPASNSSFSVVTSSRLVNMTWSSISSAVSASLSVGIGGPLVAASSLSHNLAFEYYSSQSISALSSYNQLTKARKYNGIVTWAAQVNSPPVAVRDTFTFNETTINVFNVSSNDYDIDGNLRYTIYIVSLPLYGDAIGLADGTIQYTARRGFGGRNDTLTYKICDAFGDAQCALANVTIFNRLSDSGTDLIVPYTFNPLRSQSVPTCPDVPTGNFDIMYLSSQPNCSYAAFDFDLTCYNTSLKYVGTADLILSFPLVSGLPDQVCVQVSVSQSLYYWDELTPTSSLNQLWTAGTTSIGIQWVNTTMAVGVQQQWVNVTSAGEFAEAKIPLDGSRLGISQRGGRAQLLIRSCGSVPISNSIVPVYGRRSAHPPRIILGFAPRKFYGAESCERTSFEERTSECSNAICVARDQNTTAFCSCNSGWYAADCSLRANSTCDPFWKTSQWLATDFPPVVDIKSSFECNALRFIIRSPLVRDRIKTEIRFDYNDSSACAYPGFFWTKAISEQCEDMWGSNIPWTLAKDCIKWRITQSQQWITYSAYLVVQHEDNLGFMRGTYLPRYMQHIIPIGIRFPRAVTVSTNITVFAPVRLLAAITEQIVSKSIENPAASANGKIAFDMSLQWPFMVSNVSVVSSPLPTTVQNMSNLNCPSTTDSECLQRVNLDIAPGDACELTGAYRLAITIVCRPDVTNCPLNGPATGSIVADVLSENFCSVAAMETRLNGTLVAYQDPAFTVPQQIFFATNPSYFLATLEADADLSDSIIRKVWVVVSVSGSTAGDSTIFLYNDGITPAGALAEFVLGSTNRSLGPDEAAFNFKTVSMLPDPDANAQIAVFATIDVVYTFQAGVDGATQKRTVTKRAAFNPYSTTDVVRASKIVYVSPNPPTEVKPIETTTTGALDDAPKSPAIRNTVACGSLLAPALAALFTILIMSRSSFM